MRQHVSAATMMILVVLWAAGAACAECGSGEWRCSDDAYTLEVCDGGAWKTVECMREQGKLCESGACVDPWRYGSPEWPRAEDEPRATPESLAEKARYFEEQAVRLHVNPELKWISAVVLPCKGTDCTQPSVSEEEATWRDAEKWFGGANDGLFSGLYLAAQAFKYAVTRDEDTLKMIKLLVEGEATRMRITGVPGIFTRSYVPPGVPGIECPAELSSYVPDREKDDNKWVRIGDEGCVWHVDGGTMQWVKSDHCGLEEFAGWCWLDNVSKDEYSGHLFLLAALSELVDDPEVQAAVKDMLFKVAAHMIRNGMEFVDWDGRTCQFGRIRASTWGDYAGFNAAMGLSFIKVAAGATGDPRIVSWYDDCLLQKSGKNDCLKKKMEAPVPYTDYLNLCGLYPGPEGCKANYNNTSMHMLSMFDLIWLERDPETREKYQRSFDVDVFRAADQPRAVMYQNNAWFNFMWAAMKKLGPESDGPAYEAVGNAIRMMRQFPARKRLRNVECPPDKCFHYCNDRFDAPTGKYARQAAERCIHHFVWWSDPYSLRDCRDNGRIVQPPQDYLLAYWMGRYFGFITEDM